jgi:hypothetical protein
MLHPPLLCPPHVIFIAVQASNALYGAVFVGQRLLVLSTASGVLQLGAADLLLLSNFLRSNASLR